MIMRSILTVAALVGLGSMPAAAAPKGSAANTKAGNEGWTQSDNANENACFGQARGWWASNLAQGTITSPEGTTNGEVISKRAQNGTNNENNENFIEDYCG